MESLLFLSIVLCTYIIYILVYKVAQVSLNRIQKTLYSPEKIFHSSLDFYGALQYFNAIWLLYYYLGKAVPQKGFNFLLLKRVESDINFLFSLQHGKRIAFWQIYPCILNVPITLYACFQTLLSKKPNKTLKVFTHFVFVVKSQPGFFYF